MNRGILTILALNEVRLRMRRVSTLVALMAVVALSWVMIPDPASGMALLVADGARVLYTSSTLSLGSATLGGLLFGLGGFYLVRGRMAEDIRSGTGSVIGATPVANAVFLLGRWLGACAYLASMILIFMLSVMVLHAIRGDGPIQPLVYLQNYAVQLLPLVLYTAAAAILFDSWTPLMGKAGDVLFFMLWAVQLGAIASVAEQGFVPAVEAFDFNGMAASMLAVEQGLGTTHVALGGGDFKAALAPLTLPDALWPADLLAVRCVTMVLALVPLLAACLLFHRFSPDKVKVSRAGARRNPVQVLNQMLRPVAAVSAPLFTLAARIGGFPGQVLADVALTFAKAPSAVLALIGCTGAALLAPHAAVAQVLMIAIVVWGVLVSDVSTRDFSCGSEDLAAAVPGGAALRFLRQYAATLLLALLFTGAVALRWAATEPQRALVLLIGVASMSAMASMMGRISRSARLFLALFLFWFYVSLNAGKLALIDAVGFLGAATPQSAATWAGAGALALAAGWLWNRRPL